MGGVEVVAQNSTSSARNSATEESLGSWASGWVRRAAYVAAVFARFGFASVLHVLGLDRFLWPADTEHKPDAAISLRESMRSREYNVKGWQAAFDVTSLGPPYLDKQSS